MTDRPACDLARASRPHAPTPVTESGEVGAVRKELRAADGVRIEALYEPYAGPRGRGPRGGAEVGAIVLAHGFTGHLDRPALRCAATAFTEHAAVITFSFRGHGGSGGRSTVGDLEVLDLAAAVAWARSLGHREVATVGFSMGGSVVLRHGALYGPHTADGHARSSSAAAGHGGRTGACAPGAGPAADAGADAVVAVSAPARWYYRGTAPMRRLHWAVQRPLGRLVARYGLRTRIHPEDWDPVPLSPVAAAPLIAPVPLLVVHGDRDPYFPLDHPRSLAQAAGPEGCELWVVPGFGHAENAAAMPLLHRIGDWVGERLRDSAPARARTSGARRHHGSRAADGPRGAGGPRETGGADSTAGDESTDG
ncbi:alpha/beta hydrolase [Streptomyces axinellae]|uniref:Alpha/beta fold hydrolase n=1 Tax=Streptomyces axinellae TaxID=552788 RepID=A0ABN3QD54_9ACTN